MVWVATGSSAWCSQDQNAGYMWFDKNVAKDSDDKSIFDPSPIGWRLPINGTWSDFPANAAPISDKVGTYTLGTTGTAVYAATGYRHNSAGALTSVGEHVLYYTSTPSSSTSAYRLHISTSAAAISTARYVDGHALRAIRE